MTVLHNAFFVATFIIGLVSTIIFGLLVIILIFKLLVMGFKQIAELVAGLVYGTSTIVDYRKNKAEYERWKSQKEED